MRNQSIPEQVLRFLEKIADPNNWGYFDDSGCPKGRGRYLESYVANDEHLMEQAQKILAELKGGQA